MMEAVMADTDEAFREDVLEEAMDEFFGREGHGFGLAAIAIILVGERDLGVIESKDAIVTDGDTEDIAAEIIQEFIDAAQGALDVDFPSLALSLVEQRGDIGIFYREGQFMVIPQVL